MADNTTLNSGTGGDVIRDKDRAGVKTQIIGLDLAPGGAESLMNGVMPVNDNGGSLTVDGTVAVSGTTTTADADHITDNAGFTDGTSKVSMSGYVFDEVAGTALTENDAAAARIDSKRAQVGVIEDATTRGQRATVTASNALKVDGSAVTQPVSGTVTANAGSGTMTTVNSDEITDNAGFTDGTSKLFMNGYILDETAGTALTENDAAAARIDSKRAVVNVIEDATTRGQRASVTASNALKVDNSAVTQPGNTTQLGGNAIATNTGTSSAGTQRVVIATDQPQLTNALKVDGSAVTQPISGNVGLLTRTSGGLSIFRSLDVNTTPGTVKGSAGQIYGWYFANTSTSAFVYVKFYDAASPTVGSTTPVLTIPIPAGAAANVFGDMGVAFATAIKIAATTGVADADTGAPAANQVIGNVFYA